MVSHVTHHVYPVVATSALLCYFNSLQGHFVHDDFPAVKYNHDVTGTTPLYHVFLDDFWGTPMHDPTSHKSYRPLTILTFRLNHWLGGLHPWSYHLTNVVLHMLCCFLFTRVALKVARLQPHFAAAAGLLFATHPIHTEAVSGVVGRADVLACFFFLLSFLSYHDDTLRCRNKRVSVSCQLAALSMLAKETGVMVLLVNITYDVYLSWPTLKKSFHEKKWDPESLLLARRVAKVLMVTSLLLVLRVAILQGSLPKFSKQDNPSAFHPSRHVRMMTFSYLSVFHLWLLICPSTLSHDWQMGSIPLVTCLSDTRNLSTLMLFSSCVWVLYKIFHDLDHQRHSVLVLSSLFLVLPFLPASNLLVIVGFVVAERILYIPSMGYILLVVYGAQLVHNSTRLKPVLWALLALALVSTGRTLLRNRDWASREALVRSGIRTLPHNAKMHYNLANFLRDTGQPESAKSHYLHALRLWPQYASAHNNLGTLMTESELAEQHFLSAINISPGHVNAHYNLGQVYRKLNRTVDAVDMLERCLRLNSVYAPAFLLLAKVQTGPVVGRLLRHVTKLYPNNPDYLAVYGHWLRENHRSLEAMEVYRQGLKLKSDHRNSFIGACRTLRDLGQKRRLHQQIMRWHIACKPHQSRRLVYTGDLYVRSWELYNPTQGTTTVNSTNKPPLPSSNVEVTSLLERQTLYVTSSFTEDKEKLHPG